MRTKRFLALILAVYLLFPLFITADNTYLSATKLWICDSTGSLTTDTVYVTHVVYFPAAVDNDLIITDGSDNNLIVLKAGASDTSPVHISFAAEDGRKAVGLKIGTIDGGTAYIYLRQYH